MKRMRYILIVTALMSILTISAQELAQQPEIHFESTSSMQGSGSSLVQPTEGVNVIGTETSNNQNYVSGPRRVGWDDNIGDPGAVPVGNSMTLLIIAGLYTLTQIIQTKRKA